jgi:hypothetical protein
MLLHDPHAWLPHTLVFAILFLVFLRCRAAPSDLPPIRATRQPSLSPTSTHRPRLSHTVMFTESPFRKPPESLNSNLESLYPDPQFVIPLEIEQLDRVLVHRQKASNSGALSDFP